MIEIIQWGMKTQLNSKIKQGNIFNKNIVKRYIRYIRVEE